MKENSKEKNEILISKGWFILRGRGVSQNLLDRGKIELSVHLESNCFTRTSFSRVSPRGIWAVANKETLVAGVVKNVKRASIQAFIPMHARAISLPTGEKERSARAWVYTFSTARHRSTAKFAALGRWTFRARIKMINAALSRKLHRQR